MEKPRLSVFEHFSRLACVNQYLVRLEKYFESQWQIRFGSTENGMRVAIKIPSFSFYFLFFFWLIFYSHMISKSLYQILMSKRFSHFTDIGFVILYNVKMFVHLYNFIMGSANLII